LVEQSEEELVRQLLVQLLYADDPDVTHDCELPHQELPYERHDEHVDVSDVHDEIPLVEQSERRFVRQPPVQLLYADDPYVTHDCELPHQWSGLPYERHEEQVDVFDAHAELFFSKQS
jgi:hypothetical protein